MRSGLFPTIQLETGARLAGWQFAANGHWDAAERLIFSRGRQPGFAPVENWLARQETADIALEALFDSDNGERFFFGVRLLHPAVERKAETLRLILYGSRESRTLEQVVANIRDVLKTPQLAGTAPEYLELGVFDLWNRVKSLVVWKQGERLGTRSEILFPSEIARHTRPADEGFAPLHAPQPKPLMLEAAWPQNTQNGNGFQCWVSLPVSKASGTPGLFTLSPTRYLRAARTFLGYNPGQATNRG